MQFTCRNEEKNLGTIYGYISAWELRMNERNYDEKFFEMKISVKIYQYTRSYTLIVVTSALSVKILQTKFFCGLKTSQNLQIHNFYKYKLKMLSFKFKYDFQLLWLLGKKSIRDKPMRIWIRNSGFFLTNLRICGPEHQGNLRICALRINHYKFADWSTTEMYEFAIAEWAKKFANFKFAD
jgi:hypothetical protein